ncbi:MAG: hypothetical protein HY075_04280 [Deltaproteobacteria bacterium]|nr:hypothetical protein [Deltaproteobacteria bacterium]
MKKRAIVLVVMFSGLSTAAFANDWKSTEAMKKFYQQQAGTPKDTRPTNDPRSIADEPQDPVDEPTPPPAEIKDPVVEPTLEPEITLESVTIKPLSESKHAEELEPQITLESVVVRPLATAKDLKNTKAWGNDLGFWLEVRSRCSALEGSQKTIVSRIKDTIAEFKKVSATSLKYFQDTKSSELAPISERLDDDLKAMSDVSNFRGKGFADFMARLDSDLKQAKRGADLLFKHQLTATEMTQAWVADSKALGKFRDADLKALHGKIKALKHSALCQTADKRIAGVLERISKESTRKKFFFPDSENVSQSDCHELDGNIRSLLDLRDSLGTVLLNLDGVPQQSRIVLSALIDGYRARHGLRGASDPLSEKQRTELFALVNQTLELLPKQAL